jgi:hypothetical protein
VAAVATRGQVERPPAVSGDAERAA